MTASATTAASESPVATTTAATLSTIPVDVASPQAATQAAPAIAATNAEQGAAAAAACAGRDGEYRANFAAAARSIRGRSVGFGSHRKWQHWPGADRQYWPDGFAGGVAIGKRRDEFRQPCRCDGQRGSRSYAGRPRPLRAARRASIPGPQRTGRQHSLAAQPARFGVAAHRHQSYEGRIDRGVEADTPSARNLILDNLPALRDRLAQHDIKVQRFDVDLMDRSGGGAAELVVGAAEPAVAEYRRRGPHADCALPTRPPRLKRRPRGRPTARGG